MMFCESYSVNVKHSNIQIGTFNETKSKFTEKGNVTFVLWFIIIQSKYTKTFCGNLDVSNFIVQKASQQTRWRNRFEMVFTLTA